MIKIKVLMIIFRKEIIILMMMEQTRGKSVEKILMMEMDVILYISNILVLMLK